MTHTREMLETYPGTVALDAAILAECIEACFDCDQSCSADAVDDLGEVFPFEMTMAEVACDRCGTTGNVGGQAAYMTKMGVVVRCASCDAALVRLAGTPEGYWLDLRGVRYLNVGGQ